MAHELATANDMAYTGETPWHGLGNQLRNYVATAQASRLERTYNRTCSNLPQVHHGYLSRHIRSCDQAQ